MIETLDSSAAPRPPASRRSPMQLAHARLPRHGALIALALVLLLGCHRRAGEPAQVKREIRLDYETPMDAGLQTWLAATDAALREELGMSEADTAAGVVDLLTGRVAMIRPDRGEYAASVAKIGILLAWFETHTGMPDAATAHALGLMAKASSNVEAARFSREIGLRKIQDLLGQRGFYDAGRGGGLWVGRHYGKSDERYGDPVSDHSHAATVRQVLRYFLLLEQGQLVSPAASAAMQQIFDSPDIPHDEIKFVKALAGRGLSFRRKWGTWEDWRHDAAVIRGPGRHYLLAALTHHAQGDTYLERLALAVDDHLAGEAPPRQAAK